ncbi:winged helix-turn-helix domain-containing protein [Catelliglobosispora koreensis]|uniref:winged helix-turn-helix domain-containing protein n=1 Tax=Catelliglobosispora koreensis TaxID=129052 RepID=UPI000372CAE3
MIDHYTELIETRQLKPGERLPSHAQLREEFGVSITVVRQAIQWLKAAGLIEGVHGLGTFVVENRDRDLPIDPGQKSYCDRRITSPGVVQRP